MERWGSGYELTKRPTKKPSNYFPVLSLISVPENKNLVCYVVGSYVATDTRTRRRSDTRARRRHDASSRRRVVDDVMTRRREDATA